jgi:hypothetical protein
LFLTELQALITSSESQTLELLKSSPDQEHINYSQCAFAKGQGSCKEFDVTPLGNIISQNKKDRTLKKLTQEFESRFGSQIWGISQPDRLIIDPINGGYWG